MKIPLMNISACYPQVKDEIMLKINELIDSSSFIGGKEIELFENEFASFNGTDYCIACSNGTDAIAVALKALGIGVGDTVLVPANTFIATSEAVTSVGASLAFIDVEEHFYTLGPEMVEKYIKDNPDKKIRAVIPVHLYGQMADMRAFRMLADKYNFYIIEDSAQAQGALIEDKGPGIWGDIATYSFFPGKNLGAFGDAGGITTNNKDLASICKMLTNHGRRSGEKYNHSIEGFNHRMDTLQAAILRVKLKYLEEWNEKRRKIAALYAKMLEGIIETPKIRSNALHVWYVYTVEVDDRKIFRETLEKSNIATGIYYPIILPLQPAYKAYKNHDCPVAAKQAERILSLPMYPELPFDDVEYICDTIKKMNI